MKTAGISSTLFVLVLGGCALAAKTDGFFAGVLLVPMALGPLFVSLGLALMLRGKAGSQIVLSIGAILYALWFSYAYIDIFYWHLDAQSAIGLLVVGAYALPVMAVVWLSAGLLGRTKIGKGERPASGAPSP